MKKTDFTPCLAMTPTELYRRQWTKGWALSFIGLIVYGIFRLCRQKPKVYKGICPYFEIGKNWGGLEMGWFFICAKGSSDNLKNHEVGHCIQNAVFGGFRILFLSIGSAFRYWYRKLLRVKTEYDSWWFEGQATYFGGLYVEQILKR